MESNKRNWVTSVLIIGLLVIGAVVYHSAFSRKPTDETLPVDPVVNSIETQQQSLVNKAKKVEHPSDNATADSLRPEQGTSAKHESGSPVNLDNRWVALIVEFSTGDYVQQYIEGVRQEASTFGLHLEVMDAKNNRKRMARMIDDVTLRNFDGILISHGAPETLAQSIRRSLRQGISVAAVHCEIPIPEVIKVDQDESQIAKLILEKIVADTGGKANLVLIWVPGYEPMEKRMAVYTQVMAEFPGLQEVKRFGAVTDNTAMYAEITMRSILQSHAAGTIDLVWATWDEFSQGAARAIMRTGRKEIRLYGVDISDDDLKMLQDPDNPWVATVAVDPKMLGKVQVRMLVHALLGKATPERYLLHPVLVTKSMLPKDVQVTMADLYRYVPGWGGDLDVPIRSEEN